MFTVEDGTIIADANALCTVQEVKDFCDARGLGLPEDDTTIEQSIVAATDFIFSLENCFQGSRVSTSQTLSFPRSGVSIHGLDYGDDEIPTFLIHAMARLTYDVTQGEELQPSGSNEFIIEEGVGPLRVKYADTSNSSFNPQVTFPAAFALLQPLFGRKSAGCNFPIIR